jgi:hypothetical protein
MPRAVHIFKMWAQAVWKLVMLFLGVLFGMVCLAALAVIGIRDLCQHRPCLPGGFVYGSMNACTCMHMKFDS